MVRETPLHLGHLRTMTALAEMGAIILPPVPAFYAEPKTLSDLVDQMVGRALDLLGYTWPDMRRWGEDIAKSKRKPVSPSRAQHAGGGNAIAGRGGSEPDERKVRGTFRPANATALLTPTSQRRQRGSKTP